jgi:hypothetical protein
VLFLALRVGKTKIDELDVPFFYKAKYLSSGHSVSPVVLSWRLLWRTAARLARIRQHCRKHASRGLSYIVDLNEFFINRSTQFASIWCNPGSPRTSLVH